MARYVCPWNRQGRWLHYYLRPVISSLVRWSGCALSRARRSAVSGECGRGMAMAASGENHRVAFACPHRGQFCFASPLSSSVGENREDCFRGGWRRHQPPYEHVKLHC